MRLWQFSTKAGPGVARQATPKTGFALLLDVVARNWWELIQLNLLVILLSLPLVTLPAAIVAATRICALMLDDRPVYLGRDFVEAFRNRFWKATALGVLAIAATGLSGYAAWIFLQAAKSSLLLALPLTISAATAVFAAITSAHAFALCARSDLPLAQLLRLALLGALAKPLPSLAALGFVALLWALHVVFYPVSIFMPAIINFSIGTLAVTFGVHEATARLLARERAGNSAAYAGGSAQRAR
ncbi:MAG TPA: DUF624 domain-containing protein [Devosia sp.]